ncbi:primosomal protein N' [Candidatus Entotheonellaceae bacterium PAL068K]
MQDLPAIAQVAVELPIQTPLDYQIPAPLRPRGQVGQRVLVPLGQRQVQGYIVGLATTSTVANPRDVLDVLDDTPLLTPALLELTRWVAEYYMCPWGQVLKAAIPAGFRVRSSAVYALPPDAQAAAHTWPTGKAGKVLHCLAKHGAQRHAELVQRLEISHLRPLLRRLQQQGLLHSEPTQLPPKTGQRLVAVVRLRLSSQEAQALQQRLQRRAPTQAAILTLLQQQPRCELAVLRACIPGATAAVKRLEQRHAVELVRMEKMRQVIPSLAGDRVSPPVLNQAQQLALDHIEARLTTPNNTPILLHGVTGSGKTEIYTRAIATVLHQGKTALVLVPEISLTNQLTDRFAARFESDVAVLHSGLSEGERFDEWRRLARGEARIAIGARSAVFAPLPRLGLIVVDEEHDTSYKQEELPRYHARDVAIVRAHQSGAVVVLGSATPSLEAFHRVKTGKYLMLSLPHRVEAKPLPLITIIDQRVRTTPNERIISKPLYEAIATRLRRREQCLVLINRRGFASYLQCRDCGTIPQCAHCSVSLTYHRITHALKCHYCDFSQSAPGLCMGCRGAGLRPFGLGTQQVEDTLKTLFPTARLARMDRDTTRGKAAHQRILQRLRQGELDILVGTQMIAKGHDFPNITLVGVVSADAALAVPDFRAPERLFQLLTQVAGRAGRGETVGEVYIQTYRPDHYSISFAQHHDFHGFFADEIQRRQSLHYPPYTRLARLVFESADSDQACVASQWFTTVLQRHLDAPQRLVLLGPAETPIAKMHNRYRWHLLLKAVSSRLLHTCLKTALAEAKQERQRWRGVRLYVDVDPTTFF